MKRKWLGVFIFALLVAVAFSGCDILIASLTSVTGHVVDAKSQDLEGVPNVSVKLTPRAGGSALTAVTDSDGSFVISNVEPGEYILSAESTDWFFAPKDVHVGGMMEDLGFVLGFKVGESAKTTTDTISLILVWDENFEDVDLHFTYPETDLSSSHQIFTTPYEDFGTDAFGPGVDIDGRNTSNGPTINSGRGHIYWGAKNSSKTVGYVNNSTDTRYAIQLDRDDYGYNNYDYTYNGSVRKGPRVETLSINTIPYYPSSETCSITPSDSNTLPSGSTYRWLGVMELYADAFDSSHTSTNTSEDYLSLEGEYGGAGVTLYVVQGKTLKGVYRIPDATKIKTASLVRINFFLQDEPNVNTYLYYYQILPDIRVFQSVEDIKALGVDSKHVIEAYAVGRKK